MGGSRNFLDLVAKNFDVLAGPLIALVYPLYASIKAIETKSLADDQQWLTYWVMYSLITLFELTFANVLEWFPIWPYAKLIAICWLVLPYFNGATYVYEHFVRPFYRNPQTSRIWYIPGRRTYSVNQMTFLQLQRDISNRTGLKHSERLINRADREARGRRSDYMIFDDDYRY